MNLPQWGNARIGDLKGGVILGDHGWLVADGRLVSRKDYPLLYEAIGTQYCDEDARCCNAELFNLPGG